MQELFGIYPELHSAIGQLCQGVSWRVAGVSALLRDPHGNMLFELTKPKHWVTRADGHTVVGIGGLGGTLEQDESLLDGLYREIAEELGADIEVASAKETLLVYEEDTITTLALSQRELPCPALFTISRNLFRQQELAGYPILAIATFMAMLRGEPQLDDLFGILTITPEQIEAVFGPSEISLSQVLAMPGVQVSTREPWALGSESERVILRPTWTGRSLQTMLHQGLLQSR